MRKADYHPHILRSAVSGCVEFQGEDRKELERIAQQK